MSSARTQQLLSFVEASRDLDQEELALVVSEMCINDTDPLTASEAAIAYDILQRLYPDAQMQIRRRLAERFAIRDDIPHSLIVMLANDQIDIARLVIMHSPLLGDDDLIKLIVEKSRDHRLAVSVRRHISAKVADALVYLGDDAIMVNLVRNDGASFSDHALKRLVTASRTNQDLQDPLLKRPEMRADLAALMYQWVGQTLRQFIAQNYGAALSMLLDAEVEHAAADALHDHHTLSAQHPQTNPSSRNLPPSADGATMKAASNRKAAPAGSPILNVLLVALRRSDLQAVEDELKSCARLPLQTVQHILYNDNGESLAVVCRALDVGRNVFSEFFTRLHGTQPYNRFTASPEHAAAMQAFDKLSPKQAGFILDHWRQHPDAVWIDPNRSNPAWELRQKTLPPTF